MMRGRLLPQGGQCVLLYKQQDATSFLPVLYLQNKLSIRQRARVDFLP